MSQPVIAIFDVGKTNKKLFLFNENYEIVYERATRFKETVDEDGDNCEDLENLKDSLFNALKEVITLSEFELKAINFTAYGASLVYLDKSGDVLTPLYNYLKAYPEGLKHEFYSNYGGEESFSLRTASPVLGSLNSGMQAYRLKKERPDLFVKIRHVLHLPQYLSFLLTQQYYSDITSIGCHTNMWDFLSNNYHYWIKLEGLDEKMPTLVPCNTVVETDFKGNRYQTGIGLHDSSAALIPYLTSFSEPFILLSTGTWCISFNPFNHKTLTQRELKSDCLAYLSYEGKPVKASRLFAGNEHERETARIALHFKEDTDFYKILKYDREIIIKLKGKRDTFSVERNAESLPKYGTRNLTQFATASEAYNQLMMDIIEQQVHSTNLVVTDKSCKRIFVDGGFGKNSIFMNLLADSFPGMEVFAASMAQASALGAALAIHDSWNPNPIPRNIIELKYYSCIPL